MYYSKYGDIMLEEYNKLKENNNDKIVFIKRGYFYYTYFRDSYIMSYIFNYKAVESRCSFPITNKVCVCNKLNELNIGYIIDNDIIYGDSEVYSKYFSLCYDKVNRDIIIEDINNKLIILDINKLVNIRNKLVVRKLMKGIFLKMLFI